jgi:hypothetical protein
LPGELVPGDDISPEGRLPLADWRARAFPGPPDESCVVVDGGLSDPRALAAAAVAAGPSDHALLATDELLLVSSTRPQPLRGLECPVTDPVTFALRDGRSSARFPRLPGWSAGDAARRAVAEHRSWLCAWGPEPDPSRRALGLLLTAARAALFMESVERGRPALPLTAAATVDALGDSTAAAALEELRSRRRPSPDVVAATAGLVSSLSPYAAAAPKPARPAGFRPASRSPRT